MTDHEKTRYEDHLGNEYPSLAAMLKAYGITDIMYRWRYKRKGWSLEKTLTTPAKDTTLGGASECEDHLGNKFMSKKDMCDYWRIPRAIYHSRIRSGWSVEKALTTPLKNTRPTTKTIKDHLGNRYRSLDEMCLAYGISKRDYITNIKNGLPLERALSERTELPKSPKDHLGNIYPSFNKMLEAYGVSKDKLRSRLELGWTLKDILETPENVSSAIRIKDQDGREFESQKDMMKYHGVQEYNFRYRQRAGFDIGRCLSTKNLHVKLSIDHHGNEFACVTDMLEYWSATPGTYYKAKNLGKTTEQCLIGARIRLKPLPPDMKIISVIGTYYVVSVKGHETAISDIRLHAMIRRIRVDKYLAENGNVLPDGTPVAKRPDDHYTVGIAPLDAILSSDALFRLIFFAKL